MKVFLYTPRVESLVQWRVNPSQTRLPDTRTVDLVDMIPTLRDARNRSNMGRRVKHLHPSHSLHPVDSKSRGPQVHVGSSPTSGTVDQEISWSLW